MSTIGLLQRLVRWTQRVPMPPAQERHNALMLQTTLVVVFAASLAMACLPNAVVGGVDRGDLWIAPAICVYTGLCLYLLRSGRYPLSARLTVAGMVLLIAGSYRSYGLQAQPGQLMIHMMPLLLSGLLIGRAAVWWTLLATVLALSVGAWVDLHGETDALAAADALPNLLLGSMNYLILAVALDRLILASQRAARRSDELNAACERLSREIAEKELAHARLLHTQRMEALGRLSASVAHDFNNVLSVIVGLAEAPAPQDGRADTLPTIRRAAQRGIALTRRLLSFSRIQHPQVSEFDLSQALEEMRPLILPMFGRNVQVQLRLPEEELPLLADRDQLELALLNIASNASDAMPDGGRFALRARRCGGEALIELEDTGAGMSPDVRARLFEPFFTTKRPDRGTGIGMSIVQRFVLEHGGGIEVDSAPGRGTRVRLRLPCAAP